MAIIKPNNNTLSSITALPAAISTGKVLQVLQNTSTSNISTTSSDYQASGVSVNITPSSTSNKILILIGGGTVDTDGTGRQIDRALYKNSSILISIGKHYFDFAADRFGSAISYLDSPSTTSQITYSEYFKRSSTSGTVFLNNESSTYHITAMEIAG